jgi:ATP-dependent Lon protease
MTGEVTLRGKILEIGGVKEKVLAAYRANITHVILPSGNKRDLRDVPQDVREGMTFDYVDRMDQIFELALMGEPRVARGDAARPPGGEGPDIHPPAEPDRQAAKEK